jgi:hypothetical protein
MLGLVVSLLVSATPAFAPASVTCPDEPQSCAAAAAVDLRDAAPVEGPRDYATPAVNDCPAPSILTFALAGECDGTPRDMWYRASRYPESERSGDALVSSGQGRDRGRHVAACDGLPRDGGDLTVSAPQPLALFALPALALAERRAPPPTSVFCPPFRTDEPAERPPPA